MKILKVKVDRVTAVFPKKDLGDASDDGVYIRHEPFVKITFLKSVFEGLSNGEISFTNDL